MSLIRRPEKQGLYDPQFERDNCGVGFVAHIKGEQSHQIIDDAREILVRMTHRGAVGSDRNTGDGAGMMTSLPWDFLEDIAREELQAELPPRGSFSAGLVFLPRQDAEYAAVKAACERIVRDEGAEVMGWRSVPVDNSMIGPTALASEPRMEQMFVKAGGAMEQSAFERTLYLVRKRCTNEIRGSEIDSDHFFYICSLSTRVMVYKGMLMPEQLTAYFSDLRNPRYKSHLAMVHSRFSTNTFPSWDRAQPLRFMSHNGEINTLRGNVNKMRAREGKLASPVFGEAIDKLRPVIEPDLSDSGSFDNVLELLLMSGVELPEAVMMMVPEAWQNHTLMPDAGKAMYEYLSAMMEPWDGPASIVFTDGHYIGATLDRNGLRPSRYYLTRDDRVIMASEVGVLDIDPADVVEKGRLQPGRMFLVDFEQGRIIGDEELKDGYAARHPYREWLDEQRITLDELPKAEPASCIPGEDLLAHLRLFGITLEHLNLILKPMAESGKEPLGSMGNDAPLACLSDRPRLMYEYFKQLFAQVTNPPIDSIRENIVMSLASYIGPEQNLLEATPEHAHRLYMPTPFITNAELASIKNLDYRGWKTRTIDITYPVDPGYRYGESEGRLEAELDRISREAEQAIADDYALVVLSDRAAGPDRVAIGALPAVGAVHQYLVSQAKRTQIGIVLESGEPREVHHFCTLVGFGADAVNPYLAYEAMIHLRETGALPAEMCDDEIVERYHNAMAYGMRKVFGKMGISTLESYKGAQIFEAVGVSPAVMDRCFTGTASRIQGIGFAEIEREAYMRHELAYPRRNRQIGSDYLPGGDYQYRFNGEKHMWDPESVADLQIAARSNDAAAYRRFAERQNARSTIQATIRGLLRFKPRTAIPLDEVEPVENIMRRFVTGAMSFGSISQEAHETLALAMNRIGGKSNTGEGGEMPERFQLLANGDSKRSAIKQVASGRFGVTIDYLTNADEIQIKMAQGAKPGEGGELPGHKVFDVIAKTRHSTAGVGLISPPPHHDIYSIEDLAQLIYDLKNANPQARISVKLVSEVGVGTVAAGVAKGHADHILISGHDGGTGASALTGIKNAGLPWELGLAEAHQTLVMNDLRSRVMVQTDGQLKTGRDVVIAALLGAEECGFATSALITMGCIMMRKCEKNTCPVGIATQDEKLRAKFTGQAEHVVNYMRFIAEDVRQIMAELGFRRFDEMVGQSDVLEADPDVLNWKSRHVDLSAILQKPVNQLNGDAPVICCIPQDHGLAQVLDRRLIPVAEKILADGKRRELELPVVNTDRAVGTMTSHVIASARGLEGLPAEAAAGPLGEGLRVRFTGSAGQSFGAWLSRGVTFELEGDANDYVGKGLSGGTIVVYPPRRSGFAAEDNIIIGNVALYGAVSGRGFFRGIAAERFCVRNSGAEVVVEGVGDHGLEYMTGGRAIILGRTGRNFAAGMSGGIGYVWDPEGRLPERVNPGMVELLPLDAVDDGYLQSMLREHRDLTGSQPAERILGDWETARSQFVKVISPAYRRVLELQRERDGVGAAAPDSSVGEGKESVHG
ncbi:glutamate synthase large subunit [Spirochaeta africana]|uniref:Glutamate synthase [NADPH] large chain n=1 Tax=Spirochaeta africana (strain ATCC 700263 / DSM 8902 / Z-7692) TaxID=889378 RepID=H9UKA1_SPIAZ|nr:glutamate synthase large subunit [Spirochaeta africana]AFG37944.1 glutamate synthase family protein [Spirochaeta africana DSM 8902]